MADAIVHWLVAQRTMVDERELPLFPGVFAIFGHGNVTCLGHALQQAGDALPPGGARTRGAWPWPPSVTPKPPADAPRSWWRPRSIGPGRLNMVTAAGVAMANRLPLLLLVGDTHTSRLPDPVLQQIETPRAPSVTANDAFRAVARYWDRVTRPEQVVQSLPQALGCCSTRLTAARRCSLCPGHPGREAWDLPP